MFLHKLFNFNYFLENKKVSKQSAFDEELIENKEIDLIKSANISESNEENVNDESIDESNTSQHDFGKTNFPFHFPKGIAKNTHVILIVGKFFYIKFIIKY